MTPCMLGLPHFLHFHKIQGSYSMTIIKAIPHRHANYYNVKNNKSKQTNKQKPNMSYMLCEIIPIRGRPFSFSSSALSERRRVYIFLQDKWGIWEEILVCRLSVLRNDSQHFSSTNELLQSLTWYLHTWHPDPDDYARILQYKNKIQNRCLIHATVGRCWWKEVILKIPVTPELS